MSDYQLYGKYIAWLGEGSRPVPMDRLWDFPFANADVFEDAVTLVNRLFYLVPEVSGPSPRVFFFFEKNVFSKDCNGDLHHVSSSFHLFDP